MINNEQKAELLSNIRVDGLTFDEEDREYIRRRLHEKFGKYARSVERISVRLRDVNGPRGGVDVRGRIKVVLRGHPSVVVEQLAPEYRPALSGAIRGAHKAVRRALQRKHHRVTRAGRKSLTRR